MVDHLGMHATEQRGLVRCGESSGSEQVGHAVDLPQCVRPSLGPLDHSVVAEDQTGQDGPHNGDPHPTVRTGYGKV